jgi:hypothetical protein
MSKAPPTVIIDGASADGLFSAQRATQKVTLPFERTDMVGNTSPLSLHATTIQCPGWLRLGRNPTINHHLIMAPILTVKAGRAQRRSEDSNWVDPMPAKGKIELEWNDDLLSFGEFLLSRHGRECTRSSRGGHRSVQLGRAEKPAALTRTM